MEKEMDMGRYDFRVGSPTGKYKSIPTPTPTHSN